MTDEQLVRAVAKRVMEWTPPEALPGTYVSVLENDKLKIGPQVGWKNKETDEFMTLEEMNKYLYWHDQDGNPLKLDGTYQIYLQFDPLTNANHRDMVVDEVISKGFSYSCYKTSPFSSLSMGWFSMFCRGSYPPAVPPHVPIGTIYWGNDLSKNRADCLAALAAVEGDFERVKNRRRNHETTLC